MIFNINFNFKSGGIFLNQIVIDVDKGLSLDMLLSSFKGHLKKSKKQNNQTYNRRDMFWDKTF